MIDYDKIKKLLNLYPEKNDTELAKLYNDNTIKLDTVRREITFFRNYLQSIPKTSPESLILIMSDAHYGRVTYDYKGRKDFCVEEAHRRLNNIKNGFSKIVKLLSNAYNFKDFHIILLGDMIDGELTFPTQQMHVELPELKQIVVATDDLINFIDDIKIYFPKIYLEGVMGNHAGDFRKHEINKGDIYLYKFLEEHYRNDDKITAKFSEEFYDIVPINKWNFLLYHGKGINSYQNIPFYGIQRWGNNRLVTLEQKWQYLLLGHFHRIAILPSNGFTTFMNGTFLTNDSYSIEKFGMDGDNFWWFLSVHKDRGVTFSYKLNVMG